MGRLPARVFAAALIAFLVGLAAACAPYLDRPLTTKEKIYQAGGVLLGLGQELEYAIRTGVIKGDAASAAVQAYDAASQLYRSAAGIAIAGADEPAAAKAYTDLLRTVDALRRQFLSAGVKL